MYHADPDPTHEADPGAEGPTVVLASRGTRLLAQVLDGLLVVPIALVAAGLMAAGAEALGVMVGVAAALTLVVYQLRLLSVEGQTIGKRTLGLRIVRIEDASNPGFLHAVVLRAFVLGAIGAIPVVGPVVGIANPLFIFSESRRCLHDYLAQTIVIEDGPSALEGL